MTVETELLNGKQQQSVLHVDRWIRNLCARYIRLATRRGWEPAVSDNRLQQIILRSAPAHIERTYRQQLLTIEPPLTMMKRLHHLEQEVRITSSKKVDEVFAAEEGEILIDKEMSAPPPYQQTTKKREPTKPCPACGDKHWKNECPYKTYRCRKCNRLGHLSKVCRAWVEKDTQGRVRTLVTTTPSRLETEVRKNATNPERLATAQD